MKPWYYRSALDELRDMQSFLDALDCRDADPSTRLLLKAAGMPEQLLPGQRASSRVTVSDNGREIIVTAEMNPDVRKQDISLSLINPRVLEISSGPGDEQPEERKKYSGNGIGAGSIGRIIPLPEPVSEEGSSATFRDCILKIRLKKRQEGSGKNIRITGEVFPDR